MTKAEEMGEWKIIETIISKLDKMPDMPIPFGDDISAIEIDNERLAVVKTDMLVGKTDVPRGMNLWQASRKAVVMNISDLASKGVKPTAILVSIGLPKNTMKKDIESIGLGLNAGAREYGAYVIGGDTNETTDLIISCMVIGIGFKDKIITRSGSCPGDILAVTGNFGKSSAGLKILLDKMKAPSDITEKLLESVFMPQARLKEGLALAESRAVTASIDSSDGLTVSLHQLKKMSHVGFKLTKIPIASEAEEYANIHGINPEEFALYGGEEYELVITINPKLLKRAQEEVTKAGGKLIMIGKAIEEEKIVCMRDGKEEEIQFRGWEHFKTID